MTLSWQPERLPRAHFAARLDRLELRRVRIDPRRQRLRPELRRIGEIGIPVSAQALGHLHAELELLPPLLWGRIPAAREQVAARVVRRARRLLRDACGERGE